MKEVLCVCLLVGRFLELTYGVTMNDDEEKMAIFKPFANQQYQSDYSQQYKTALETEMEFEKVYCLVECIQTMERKDMQLADPRVLDRQFGSWIDGPYNVFLFQAMCGTYSHHKQCLLDCPDSKSKNETLEALVPLDYACIDHYDEFVKHLPCYVNLKPTLEKVCNAECRSEEELMAEVREMQASSSEETTKDLVANSLSKICRWAACRKSCYEPLVFETCGNDAASLVHHFTSISAEQYIKEMNTAGFNKTLSVCQQLVDNEEDPVDESHKKNLIVFDSSLEDELGFIATYPPVDYFQQPTIEAPESKVKVEPGKLPEEEIADKNDRLVGILLVIVSCLLVACVVVVCLVSVVNKDESGTRRASPARKAWVSIQGFVSQKKLGESAEVLPC